LTSEPFGRCTTNGQLHVCRSVAEVHFSPDSSFIIKVTVFRLQFVKKVICIIRYLYVHFCAFLYGINYVCQVRCSRTSL